MASKVPKSPSHICTSYLYITSNLFHSPVICGHVSSGHEMVGDVRGKVDREANAHDEIDQGDAIQDNIPDSHEAKATYKMSSLGTCNL